MISLARVWRSPTAMTYGSFFARSLSLVVVLPFLLTRLPTEEIYLWYLFSTIAGFQLFIDLGFSPTFSRFIAYAMGGADVNAIRAPTADTKGVQNWAAIERIWSTMRSIYNRLGIAWFGLLTVIGTLAVVGPMSVLEKPLAGWLSWLVVVLISTAAFRGSIYSIYLQGVNEIALLRRWEIITATASAVSSVAVIVLFEDLFALVLVHYGWLLLTVLRNQWLAGRVYDARLNRFSKADPDDEVIRAVWPSTWRTGIGVVTSFGIVQGSAVIYAQLASPAESVSYFLALRLVQALSQFSQAPFYSKLPLLASMYSSGRHEDLLALAARGMKLSYLSFTGGFLILAFAGDGVLENIGSNAEFPDPLLWGTLGLAYFIERFGAMHINLYSITNDIINHVANGVAGAIYLAVGAAGYAFAGILAFPLALIAGNAGFYAWYAASHSYRAFGLGVLRFENKTMSPYFLAVLVAGAVLSLL